MKAKRILIPIILVVAIIAAIVVYSRGWFNSAPSNRLAFSGNIEMTEVKIAFRLPGKIEELSLKEGDRVKAGDVIARLDTAQLRSQKERVQAARLSSTARLDQVNTTIDLQAETVEGQIEQRRAEVGNAEAILNELLAGSRKQDIEQARAALERARTEHQTAERDWQRAQTLFKDEDISAAAHDQARSRFEGAAAAVKQAEERLSLVQEGPRAETIEAARAQVRRAQAGLRLAEAARLEVKRTRQEREARAADIAQVDAELGVVDAQLSDSVALAPADGVVLIKSAEDGEVVAAGSTILTLGDIEHPWLRGYVGEKDLGRIKLGMPVRITTDSFPGKVYQGKIAFISSEAEFTPKQIQTPEERVKLVYRIKVDVENTNHELKSNMPADAEIVLE
ncbi:MAG: HlyD family efflux transporter periplasmic adaptor subunit [Acidobacteria bacterium]|nr:MAG: HlyD family efflux transporter periplasmic adaptor subunit [Acidobacteriota bacterium]